MKKLLIAFAMLITSFGVFAQAKDSTKTKKAKTAKTATTKTTTAAGPTKKDGTADMRYKANKDAAKPVGPTKKDGTADMRYKANKKDTVKKKKS
jgi:hypothetical protein